MMKSKNINNRITTVFLKRIPLFKHQRIIERLDEIFSLDARIPISSANRQVHDHLLIFTWWFPLSGIRLNIRYFIFYYAFSSSLCCGWSWSITHSMITRVFFNTSRHIYTTLFGRPVFIFMYLRRCLYLWRGLANSLHIFFNIIKSCTGVPDGYMPAISWSLIFRLPW